MAVRRGRPLGAKLVHSAGCSARPKPLQWDVSRGQVSDDPGRPRQAVMTSPSRPSAAAAVAAVAIVAAGISWAPRVAASGTAAAEGSPLCTAAGAIVSYHRMHRRHVLLLLPGPRGTLCCRCCEGGGSVSRWRCRGEQPPPATGCGGNTSCGCGGGGQLVLRLWQRWQQRGLPLALV